MKRRENALKRVRGVFTRDRDHDAPCPAQSLTMRWLADMRKGGLGPAMLFSLPTPPSSRPFANVTTARAPSDRVRTGAII
jgi:hypothetical protein